MPRPRDISDEDLLRVLAETDERVLRSSEVAEAVGFKQTQSVNQRLTQLAAMDLVEFRNGDGYLWWITDEGLDRLEQLEE